MQEIEGRVVYSATDLVAFLACQHLTNLDRAATAGLVRRPMRDDPEFDRIAKRGLQHEARFLAELEKPGVVVTRIDPDASIPDPGDRLREAADKTLDAMHRGDEVIYQAAFFDGERRGHPDFLRKVDRPSALGNWSYEVWDTKLARSAKGSSVLQLCQYSDLLDKAQGLKPDYMYLALGGSEHQQVALRFDDYAAYYRLIRKDFEELLHGEAPTFPPATRPDPVEHCDVCRWSMECRQQLRKEDDLSLVAGISANQRRQLRSKEVGTRGDLAKLELPLERPLKGSNGEGLVRVRDQARIQVQGDEEGRVISELVEPSRTRNGELEPDRGLLSLPPPSEGDLFFDIEGDPFAMEDGVDYLFGVIEPRLTEQDGQPKFHYFWSIDQEREITPEAERTAFEAFIDLVMDRLELDPNLHIYHYAPYEPTAVKRLMGRYGTREDEVDRLLRGSVFIDLFRAARQGIRASIESYSIKKLEPLYGFTREVDLRDAGSSIVAFETWLELGGDADDDPDILQRIQDYNRDDCVSTWKLRDWLEEQRLQLAEQLSLELPRPLVQSGDASVDLNDALLQTQALVDQLVVGVSEDITKRSQEEQAQWLLAQLLFWHRREDKSAWWRYFYLKDALTDEDRITEPDALGGLTPLGFVETVKRSNVYRFAFPPQDHKISVGSSPHDPATGKPAGEVVRVDDDAGIIDLKRAITSGPPEATSLIPLEIYNTKDQRQSLLRIAQSVVENGFDAAGPYRAARDLLLRRAPNAGQSEGANLKLESELSTDAAKRLALQIESSYLAVQGPPGSGKTSVGADMIVDLVLQDRKVGVLATSHKVIGQMLEKVAEVAVKRKVKVNIGQRADKDESGAFAGATLFDKPDDARVAIMSREIDVLGATNWQWCRDDMQDAVDVLFVDEAGQMSLANVIAASGATKSIVLLGDPQQLDQPLKGSHPPGADKSALAHVIGNYQTMPSEMGLFLDGTWRLHPDICRYTSEVFYDRRLSANPGCELQNVAGFGVLSGTGIRFIAVPHQGHSGDSEEEAEAIDRLLTQLLAAKPTWTNADGETAPLTAKDLLLVTPYNAQVRAISDVRPGLHVGTVDKFQGQEAPISIYSMATSSADDAPRGMEFLYSLNRLNVATSRARCLAVIVASPDLVRVRCKTPRQMKLANALARLIEMATS